eukprot:197138_1
MNTRNDYSAIKTLSSYIFSPIATMSITYKSFDELIIWDHPNSHLIILQSKRLLHQYDVFFDTGFNESRFTGARYETKRVDGGRKAYCRYSMPGSPHKLFVANGGVQSDKYSSMRLATFRVIQQIFTYIFDFDWDGIEFHLTPTREGGFRCKSSKIKLPQRGLAKHSQHFRTERITRAYDRSKNYPAYCRIGAGIEFIDKLCHNLEYIGPAASFRHKQRYGWHKHNKKHRSYDHNTNRRKPHDDGFNYYRKFHPAPAKPNKKQRMNSEQKMDKDGDRGDRGAGFNFGSLLEHMHSYDAVNMSQNIEQNLMNVQKNLQYEPGDSSTGKPVREWNYYALIYWFNRVHNGAFSGIKYTNFRKHLYIGRVKGSELGKINEVILKMAGIMDPNEHRLIIQAIRGLMAKDVFDNVVANAIRTDDIPNVYFDPITYEIMHDPVVCAVSGNFHERRVIEEYIKLYQRDPCTQKTATVDDLVGNKEMKSRIKMWLRDNFDLCVV